MTRTTTMIAASFALAALAGCGGDDGPVAPAGNAQVAKDCVENASKAYGVALEYITLGDLEPDPSGGYAYAYRGQAALSSSATRDFLCRLDANQAFVDIATVGEPRQDG